MASHQKLESRGLTTSDETNELAFLKDAMDVFMENLHRAITARSPFYDQWNRYKSELEAWRYARDRRAEILRDIHERFETLRTSIGDAELRELMGFNEWQEDIDRQVELRPNEPAGHGGKGSDEV